MFCFINEREKTFELIIYFYQQMTYPTDSTKSEEIDGEPLGYKDDNQSSLNMENRQSWSAVYSVDHKGYIYYNDQNGHSALHLPRHVKVIVRDLPVKSSGDVPPIPGTVSPNEINPLSRDHVLIDMNSAIVPPTETPVLSPQKILNLADDYDMIIKSTIPNESVKSVSSSSKANELFYGACTEPDTLKETLEEYRNLEFLKEFEENDAENTFRNEITELSKMLIKTKSVNVGVHKTDTVQIPESDIPTREISDVPRAEPIRNMFIVSALDAQPRTKAKIKLVCFGICLFVVCDYNSVYSFTL